MVKDPISLPEGIRKNERMPALFCLKWTYQNWFLSESYCTIMLIYGPPPILLNRISTNTKNTNGIIIRSTYQLAIASRRCIVATAGLVTAATVLASAATVGLAIEAPEQGETLANIPQTLSGECILPNDCKKARIQKPKSRKAESCTIKCVTTCIRGGEGSPGEGPFNVRRYTFLVNWFTTHMNQLCILWTTICDANAKC